MNLSRIIAFTSLVGTGIWVLVEASKPPGKPPVSGGAPPAGLTGKKGITPTKSTTSTSSAAVNALASAATTKHPVTKPTPASTTGTPTPIAPKLPISTTATAATTNLPSTGVASLISKFESSTSGKPSLLPTGTGKPQALSEYTHAAVKASSNKPPIELKTDETSTKAARATTLEATKLLSTPAEKLPTKPLPAEPKKPETIKSMTSPLATPSAVRSVAPSAARSTTPSTAPSTPSALTTGSGQAVTKDESKEKLQAVLLDPTSALIDKLKPKHKVSVEGLLQQPYWVTIAAVNDILYWSILAKGAASLAASVDLVGLLAPNIHKQLLEPWINKSPEQSKNAVQNNLQNIFMVSSLLMLYAASMDPGDAAKSKVHDIVAGLLTPVMSRGTDVPADAYVENVLSRLLLRNVLATLAGPNSSSGYLETVLTTSRQDVTKNLIPKVQILKEFLEHAVPPPAPVKEFGYKWRDEWTIGVETWSAGQKEFARELYQLPHDEWIKKAEDWCKLHASKEGDAKSSTFKQNQSSAFKWNQSLGDEWRGRLGHEWEQISLAHPVELSQVPVKNLAYYAVEHVLVFTIAAGIDIVGIAHREISECGWLQ